MAYTLTDEDKKIAAQLAAQMSAEFNAGNPLPQAKKAGSFLTNLIPTLAGAGGAILGTLVAPGLGTAAGGAGGSMLGKKIQNMITGEQDNVQDYVTEGLFGAIPGAGGVFKAAKGAITGGRGAKTAVELGEAAPKGGFLSRVGGWMENKGSDLAATQANLTRAQARDLGVDVPAVFNNLQRRTGMADMEALSKLSGRVTGGNGIVNLGVENSVRPLSVDIGDLSTVANKTLADNAPAVFGASRKAIEENVKNNLVKAYGGSEGSLSSVVGGNSALDTSKEFAKQAASYNKAFRRSGNVADQQTGKVYQTLSETINDRLYRNPNSKDLFLRDAKPAILDEFDIEVKDLLKQGDRAGAKAMLQLKSEFQTKVTNVSDARKFQKDFVELGKISQKSAEGNLGAATSVGGELRGAGRVLQRPTNMVAMPLEAATPKISSTLQNLGRRMQGRPAVGVTDDALKEVGESGAKEAGKKVTRRDVMKALLLQGVPRAAFGGLTAASPDEEMNPEVLTALQGRANLPPEAMAMADGGGGTAPNQPPISKEQLDQAILQAAMEGDKETVSMAKTLAEYFYPAASSKQSAATQKGLVSLGSAENLINNFEQELGQAGLQENGVLARIFGGGRSLAGNVGLDPNAATYNSLRQGTVAQLAKALGDSGTLTDQDIQRAINLIPDLSRSQEEANAMFAQLRELISSNRNTLTSAGSPAAVFGGY